MSNEQQGRATEAASLGCGGMCVAAMSRRAKKHSPLSAVVVQFNRRAKRYERRGILVTSRVIEQAEKECLSDADQRAAQRKRGVVQRAREDEKLVNEMTATIHDQFPGCPAQEARQIASHTARRGSGRVDRLMGRGAGTVSLSVSDGVCFWRRMWLPFLRTTTHPSRCRARMIRLYGRLGTLLIRRLRVAPHSAFRPYHPQQAQDTARLPREC